MNKKIEDVFSKHAPDIAFFPGNGVYEQACQFFKRTLAPSVVVRPTSSEDMAAVICLVNEYKLPFVIPLQYVTSY